LGNTPFLLLESENGNIIYQAETVPSWLVNSLGSRQRGCPVLRAVMNN
jgi:hypothetical protein